MSNEEERVKLYREVIQERKQREEKLKFITNDPPGAGVYENMSRMEQYQVEVEHCMSIFEERNAIYKDTFVYLGLQGTITTLIGDVFRLRNMIIWEEDHGRSHYSQIEDKLIDVVNQAVISLMMLRDKNFEGK